MLKTLLLIWEINKNILNAVKPELGSYAFFTQFGYTKLKALFGFCEALPAFQTPATLAFRAIKRLVKNPKTFFNSV